MPVRFVAGRTSVRISPAGRGLLAVSLRSLAALLLPFGLLLAQDPTPTPTPTPAAQPPANQPPANQQPAAQPPAAQAPAAAAKYGKLLLEGSKLRCWPSAVVAPPVFEDVLAKDQVVGIGRSESGFRAIVLPLGPIGYVNKKFAVVDDLGLVRTKGAKVAFRYQPRTNEAPVAQLTDATELAVVGEHEDWWRVRVAPVEAWLPEAEVQVLEGADAAALASYAALEQAQRGEVQVRLDQIAAQKQQEKQNQADEAAVMLVQDAFGNEMKKPIAEQQFDPLEAALTKLDESIAKESSAKVSIAALRQRIKTQKWLVEATILTSSKAPPSTTPQTPPQPKDELERFQSIGWLRYEGRLAGIGTYYLEKGGIRQHLVSCSTGRYDLALFVGREVGINGPRRRPATESLSVLDVERLEVLGGLPK
jgi:hypothetical protein